MKKIILVLMVLIGMFLFLNAIKYDSYILNITEINNSMEVPEDWASTKGMIHIWNQGTNKEPKRYITVKWDKNKLGVIETVNIETTNHKSTLTPGKRKRWPDTYYYTSEITTNYIGDHLFELTKEQLQDIQEHRMLSIRINGSKNILFIITDIPDCVL